MATFHHIPVLLQAVLDGLAPRPGGSYIDGTVGGGGHSAALLAQAGAGAALLGIDADPTALAAANERFAALPPTEPPQHWMLAHGNVRNIAAIAAAHSVGSVDGILLDLGVSSYQLDTPERGFSFSSEAPLDMRLDTTQGPTAADLVNELDEQELADVIYQYGEERGSRRIARFIVEQRRKQPFTTTTELAATVARALGGRQGRIHPATRTFQALRIAVNGELDSLQAALPQAVGLLGSGGRLAIISFHSLEDRIVKQFFRDESGYGGSQAVTTHPQLRILTKKPVEADENEIARNPRSRSAKLRVAEKL